MCPVSNRHFNDDDGDDDNHFESRIVEIEEKNGEIQITRMKREDFLDM